MLKDVYRKDTVSIRNQRMMLVITIFFCLVDCLVVMFNMGNPKPIRDYSYPWLTEMLKPILAVGLSRPVRSYFKRFWYVMKGSFTMVIFIVAFVYFFSYAGIELFAGSVEGGQTFTGMRQAYDTLFITITTSNYPNVMLPSYGANRLTSFFFLIYMTLGLFLFMNLMLAIIYNSY